MSEEKLKLLIVEDDPGLQKQLKWCFDSFEVLQAGSRAEAIALMRRYEPSVVLQDLGLPPDPEGVSEGMATLRELLQLEPRAKIIVVTGEPIATARCKPVGMGAWDFYSKPVDTEVLKLIVQRAFHIARSRGREPAPARVALTQSARGHHRHRRVDAEGVPHRGEGGAQRRHRCCCSARAAPARNWWRAPSMHAATARTNASWPSTARRFRNSCSKASCSASRKARSPGAGKQDARQGRGRRGRHAVPR